VPFDIPDSVPEQLVAGDHWQFYVTLPDYATTEGWTLAMYLEGQSSIDGSGWTFTAQSGNTWLVQVSAATTATYTTSGRYRWYVTVTSGSEKYTAAEGWVQLLRNPRTVAGDLRSHTAKMVAYLEAALEARLSGSKEEAYSIGGRSLTLISTAEIRRQLGYYRAALRREQFPGEVTTTISASARRPT
jgi:hypothetical protein